MRMIAVIFIFVFVNLKKKKLNFSVHFTADGLIHVMNGFGHWHRDSSVIELMIYYVMNISKVKIWSKDMPNGRKKHEKSVPCSPSDQTAHEFCEWEEKVLWFLCCAVAATCGAWWLAKARDCHKKWAQPVPILPSAIAMKRKLTKINIKIKCKRAQFNVDQVISDRKTNRLASKWM